MGGRYHLAVFEVRDDQFGTVGIGEIAPDVPGELVLGMGGRISDRGVVKFVAPW